MSAKSKRPQTSKVLKKNPTEKPIASAGVPSFQNRRTLADHVRDNMMCSGRRSYFQRIIYVYKLLENVIISEDDYNDTINEFTKIDQDQNLTGILINYSQYSVHMIEGSEKVLGRFLTRLIERFEKYWSESKIIVIYNNANQRFFQRCIIKIAEPLETIDKIPKRDEETEQSQIENLLRRIYDLCGKMHSDEIEENKTARSKFLTGLYIKILPEVVQLDFILQIKELQSIVDYGKIFGRIPDMVEYEDQVWPLPHDYLPHNVFEWGKYDVNLICRDNKRGS